MEETQIQIMKTTRERLSSIGKHKETYDDIIKRLLDSYVEAANK